MKLQKLMAVLCGTTMLAASLAGCGGGKEAAPAATTAAAKADSKEESKAETTAAAADEEKFQLDLATTYAADAPIGVAIVKFADEVREKSGGSIDISVFTDGTLGKTSSDNYTAVSAGDLDMSVAGLEGLDLYAPEYTFLDAPFLMSSLEQRKAILDSGIGDALKERYAENGIVTLGWHDRDIRVLASNREVKGPQDVNGMKLRLPGMTVYVDTWSQLGISSTTVAMNELYTALQTNVAEACEGGYEQMTTLKLYEVQKNIMETDHVYEFVGLFINKDLWEKMSDNQKEILQACADENLKYADELAAQSREEYKKACLDGGMNFVEVDKDAFHAMLEDYYKKQFETKWTVTTYDEVMKYAK